MSSKKQVIANVCFLVPDYDEAIDWFISMLSFTKTADIDQGNGKRWVVVKPSGGPNDSSALKLEVPSSDAQRSVIGNQAGSSVFLFLYTDDFWRDYEEMKTKGVEFMEKPREETYGTVAVFKDKWGNRWDFMQPS